MAGSSNMIDRNTIKVIAESVGIPSLKDEVADALAPDVEYRLREVVQEALKFMRHGRRETLSTDDINYALRLRRCEPVYGFGASEATPRFCRAVGTSDVFYVDDPELSLAELVAAPLPAIPLEPSFSVHWLAVNGVQPTIPQNPTQADDARAAAGSKRPREDAASAVVPLARHVLSSEEQSWLDRVFAVLRQSKAAAGEAEGEEGPPIAEQQKALVAVLRAIATEGNLHALSAQLVQFVASEVHANLTCLPMLVTLLRVVQAMLVSPVIDLEPYLHQLMPLVLTCLVGKRLCSLPHEDHWGLRKMAARLLHRLLQRFGGKFADLQPRITKTLVEALLDSRKPLTTHYGAIIGLELFGLHAVHCLLMPTLPPYIQQLQRILYPKPAPRRPAAAASASDSGPAATAAPAAAAPAGKVASMAELAVKQMEALRVYDAALHVCADYFFRRARLFAVPTKAVVEATAAMPAAAAPARAHSKKGGGAPSAAEQPKQTDEELAKAAAAAQAAARGAAELLPQIAGSYHVLSDEFGPALFPYTQLGCIDTKESSKLLNMML